VAEKQAAFETVPLGCHERVPGQVCWPIERWSPQEIFDETTAEDDRDAAQEHGRVSLALRQAELSACAGVDERDLAPGEVMDAQVIQGPDGVVGARMRFHDLRRLSVDDLHRSLDCRVARDDALGHESPQLGYCPLVPRGASATVTTVPHGYMLEVRSATPSTAQEIARCGMAALKH
jgi:hypothetical protein